MKTWLSLGVVAFCAQLFVTQCVVADIVSTGPAGAGVPHSNYQPSTGINYLIALQGVVQDASKPATTSTQLGEIQMFAGSFAPQGYAFANGQLLPISQYPALFTLFGTTYGGDGQVTFALPNLQGSAAAGTGQGPGLTNRPLGGSFGSASTAMLANQLPAHDHSLPTGGRTSMTGGGQAMPIAQPTLPINFFLQTDGYYPSRGSGNAQTGLVGQVRQTAASYVGYGDATSGQTLSISGHTALFSILGINYGGNGTTTFALPDLRGRVPIGAGTGTGLSNRALGGDYGTEDVTLTTANLPPHAHALPTGGQTGYEGNDVAYNNMQPSLGLNYMIALNGVSATQNLTTANTVTADALGVDAPYVGEVTLFAGNFAPAGWALCDGSLLSITENTTLYGVIGNTYGGNGVTTFALPDLRGRTVLGLGDGIVEGENVGEESHTLTLAEMALHVHTYAVPEPASLCAATMIGFGSLSRRRRSR